jgi:SSS family solute:Na+ symporter
MRFGIIAIGIFMYIWGLYYHFTETVFRYITLTGSLAYAGMITGLSGGIYWKKASSGGAYLAFIASAIPPVFALANPGISTTSAGLMSFVLAPACMIAGSFLFPDKNLTAGYAAENNPSGIYPGNKNTIS